MKIARHCARGVAIDFIRLQNIHWCTLAKGRAMLVQKNVTVNGRRTSMRLEPLMWESLDDICNREGTSVNEVVSFVETKVISLYRACPNLASSVRAFIADYFRAAATEERHRLAGHGCGDPVEVMAQDAAPKMEVVELPEHSGQLASEERCLIA
ncbi:ribbon-helix-helix domain-containing protein [Azospirillum brasilense]|nr:ribbon-helix-helix domain-containing protein [Azospirillum brasilense]